MSLYINWNPNQSLFHFGSFELRYYSLLFMLGFIVAAWTLSYFIKKERKSSKKLESLMTHIIIGTLLGARLGHVIFYDWGYFQNHLFEIFLPFRLEPSFEFTGFAGLASHGAVAGIFIAVYIFIRKNKEFSLSWLLDRGCIAAVVAGGFVRIGNFMNSEIVGKITECTNLFAFRFLRTQDANASDIIAKTGIRDYDKALDVLVSDSRYVNYLQSIPCRYPTQLFESLIYFVIFMILWLIYHKTNKKDTPYFLFGMFLILTWTARFVMEFIKESQGGIEDLLGLFSTGQWLSLPLIFLGIYLVFRDNNVMKKR